MTSPDHRARSISRISEPRRGDNRSASPNGRSPQYRERDYRSASALSATPSGDGREASNDLFIDEAEPTPVQRAGSVMLDANNQLHHLEEDPLQGYEDSDQSMSGPPNGTPIARGRTSSTQPPLPHIGKGGTNRRSKRVEDDPLNFMIKDLRCKHKLPWTKISERIDQHMVEQGERPLHLSEASVYSRFKRNAARIAKIQGEQHFDHADWIHMRHPHYYPHTDEYVTAAREPQLHEGVIPGPLRRNVRMTAQSQDNLDQLQSETSTKLLITAIYNVKREFYKFVADEMERVSGAFYAPQALEARYKQIQRKLMTNNMTTVNKH